MIETLKRFDIFSEVPKKVLKEIAGMAKEEAYSEGTLLFSEGTAAKKFYCILEGKVSLEKMVQLGRTGTPRRTAINVVGAGQAVGWSSMVSPFEYTTSGVCLDDVTVIAISGEDLCDLMVAQPEIGFMILNHVSSIIRQRMTTTTATLTYFLSIVSHELKRPMAAVENYLQILLGGYAGELSPKQTRLIQRSSLRLSDLRTLISDILDFARIQPEQIRADFEQVNPAEIGAEAIEEVRLAATEKDIRLKASGPTEFQPIIAARRRLRQVISNLLANAVKFSPEGSVVTLSARDEPEALLIEVRDEGIGIPEEDQSHIFDDFFRASNVDDYGGSGLGLSIAKKIIDAHHGQIEVESPYKPDGSGTKFVLTIPRTLIVPGEYSSRASEVDQEQ